MPAKIKLLFISFRARHWLKNLFIFAVLLFSGNLLNKTRFFETLLCFFCFCLISSAIYLINDLLDKKEDMIHPFKSKRPIAQGKIPAAMVIFFSFLLTLCSISAILLLNNINILIILLAYFALNILYCFFLKNIFLIDVFSIALGFELRIWAGAAIINIAPSQWLQLCTFLLALFLAFSKRYSEIKLLGTVIKEGRRPMFCYQRLLLEQLITICATMVILTYALYTLSAEVIKKHSGQYMIYTVIFVIYGISRYLYLVNLSDRNGDPTEIIISDRPLMVNLITWILSIFLIVYGIN